MKATLTFDLNDPEDRRFYELHNNVDKLALLAQRISRIKDKRIIDTFNDEKIEGAEYVFELVNKLLDESGLPDEVFE